VKEEWEFFEPISILGEDSGKLVREMRDDRGRRIMGEGGD